jgi:hypothetical protein
MSAFSHCRYLSAMVVAVTDIPADDPMTSLTPLAIAEVDASIDLPPVQPSWERLTIAGVLPDMPKKPLDFSAGNIMYRAI